MDTKELRLGNLIVHKYHDAPERVTSLKRGSNKINGSDAELFYPIPLNEQWLEDFGFEFGADVLEWGIDIGEDKSLHMFKEGGEYFCCIKELDESATFPKEVGSVHTLQNLFWCLTGQELELKKQ